MKFELNDYHRNVSDEELLRDVKDTAQKLGKVTLTTDEYKKMESTITVLSCADLAHGKKFCN